MINEKWLEKKIHQDKGYFLIKKIDNEKYEASFILNDPCGGKMYHPKLTLIKERDNFKATQLYDTVLTPIVFLKNDSLENEHKLQQTFDAYIEDFQRAIGEMKND
ncbi:MAG: hypothetical protein LBV67_02565 [Streptococcaceae bacterium]|jgi:hypothetical protein|nr:hypothetical protein [Streptococcaceae bacterium]